MKHSRAAGPQPYAIILTVAVVILIPLLLALAWGLHFPGEVYTLLRISRNMAEEAGFKLAGKSEINANPKDTKDYEKGVWTLPPVYRLKDQDREKYTAIGESDRMTLKFVKP